MLVKFHEDKLPTKIKELEIGDHFGEISMIYKCPRTATVRSTKYATIGYLDRTAFKQVIFKFQEIVDLYCKEIYYYDDDLKLFKEKTMRYIPYFKDISEDSLQAMIMMLESSHHEKGFMIFNEDSLVNKIVIVQDGLVDIETTVDNNIFVIQSLPGGSIMNYKKFIQNTKFRIQARCKTHTSLLTLSLEDFNKLCTYYDDIKTHFRTYMTETYRMPKKVTIREIVDRMRKSKLHVFTSLICNNL